MSKKSNKPYSLTKPLLLLTQNNLFGLSLRSQGRRITL